MSPSDYFDSETIALLHAARERAWAELPPERRTPEMREQVTAALMWAAQSGERNPERLVEIAKAAGLH